MTKEILNYLKNAGVIATAITMGGVGGYFISDTAPTEVIEVPVFNYWGEEGQIVMDAWNEMLAEKKANCELETDCIIEDGVEKVVFENISTNDIPTQLKSKLGDYNIKLEKK